MTTLRQLLQKTHHNLQILHEREAKYGGNAPLELLNQIDDHVQAIALTEQAIAGQLSEAEWREAMQPLLVAIENRSAGEASSSVTIGDITGGIHNSVIAGRDVHITYIQPGPTPPKIEEEPPLPFEPKTILIPAGPFIMGSDTGEAVEKPAHSLSLSAFKISQYPVTVAQYAEFIKRVKQQELPKMKGWSLLREPPAHKLNHPVTGVSWHEAEAYCRWLSEQTGRVYRLPYETEWEKAASWTEEQNGRGHKRQYPWGDEFDPGRCNGKAAGKNDTTPAGSYSPQGDSAYGCADMAGNVQEWTRSLWGDESQTCAFPYPYNARDGRENLAADQQEGYRVLRGGSFRDEPARLRCSVRVGASPSSRVSWRGFRLVLEI